MQTVGSGYMGAAVLTAVIPYVDTDSHTRLRAAASVAQQSVPMKYVTVYDKDRRGASWARNRGLEQVETEFVTFLDADDHLEPWFAFMTLREIRPGHFVYTDFWRVKRHIRVGPPVDGWKAEGLVTRVIRTNTARLAGGFDESIDRMEDIDFWLRVQSYGIAPVYVPQPLVTYSKSGKRSARWKSSSRALYDSLVQRYKTMADKNEPIIEQQPSKPVKAAASNASAKGSVTNEQLYKQKVNILKVGKAFSGAVVGPRTQERYKFIAGKPLTVVLVDAQSLVASGAWEPADRSKWPFEDDGN